MVTLNTRTVFYVTYFVALLLATNFESNLGTIFALFIVGAFFLITTDKKVTYPIGKIDLKSISWGVGAYVFYLLVSTVILALVPIGKKLVDVQIGSISSVLELIKISTASTLTQTFSSFALQGNPWIIFVAYAGLIAISESIFFFGPGMEFIADAGKLRAKVRSTRTLALVLVISAAFTIFHLTSKGANADQALMLVAIFAAISCYLVIIRKQIADAIIFHIIANGSALLLSYNIILISGSSFLFYAIGTGAVILLASRLFKIRTIGG